MFSVNVAPKSVEGPTVSPESDFSTLKSGAYKALEARQYESVAEIGKL